MGERYRFAVAEFLCRNEEKASDLREACQVVESAGMPGSQEKHPYVISEFTYTKTCVKFVFIQFTADFETALQKEADCELNSDSDAVLENAKQYEYKRKHPINHMYKQVDLNSLIDKSKLLCYHNLQII